MTFFINLERVAIGPLQIYVLTGDRFKRKFENSVRHWMLSGLISLSSFSRRFLDEDNGHLLYNAVHLTRCYFEQLPTCIDP